MQSSSQINIFRGKTKPITEFDFDLLFNYVRFSFRDPRTYKWKVSLFDLFVQSNKLDSQHCILVLNDLLRNPKAKVSKNKQGFKQFVESLNSRLKTGENKKLVIRSKSLDFMKNFYVLIKSNCLATDDQIFALLSENFDTGYSLSTIRRYHYEKKF